MESATPTEGRRVMKGRLIILLVTFALVVAALAPIAQAGYNKP
jgi:hypothetical protein